MFLDDPSVYFQNMQNQALPVQFVPPNQTEIAKEQTHEFERKFLGLCLKYEANNLAIQAMNTATGPHSKQIHLVKTHPPSK